ncbi:glutathione transferase [Castellaniella caeni]|uniref:glutathione transferase n=1 Tax=Castellaniella caeni TaxID=266123 RepID=UPI0008332132|nr:glutathione transferase [Castellaniella caeni]
MSHALMLYTDARFISPYAMSAFVALAEKDVPFEMTPVDLAKGEQRQADFLALALTGKVPALVHGEFTLTESTAIIEYVDEAFPGPALFPQNPQHRARARQIQAWVRTDLGPLRQERPSDILFEPPVQALAPLSGEAQQAADKLLRVAEQLVPKTGHLFDAWSIADFDLAFMLNRLVAGGDPVPARLADYVHQQWGRSSVQRWVGFNERQRK